MFGFKQIFFVFIIDVPVPYERCFVSLHLEEEQQGGRGEGGASPSRDPPHRDPPSGKCPNGVIPDGLSPTRVSPGCDSEDLPAHSKHHSDQVRRPSYDGDPDGDHGAYGHGGLGEDDEPRWRGRGRDPGHSVATGGTEDDSADSNGRL